ncbi:cofactor FMO1 FAD enzyme [Podospora fimiseda]|uniref:Cofactor FMO1 FAD enzyme n=1 Tax=Podospora fimiseda TaxID=252190 RepID=A0AAN6YML2_9PEZI|nr:cofactor FMO1 FAD enzyme [Podospora fimiseda]
MQSEKVDVVVVGTGWSGLICAKTYLDFSPNANLILIEKATSVGGVWNKENIYPNLYAQIKYGQFEYSFCPMRKEGVTHDNYISGETINTYLEEFAKNYGLLNRTRFRTTVVKVLRLSDGNGWRLHLELEEKGQEEIIDCIKLIYASGCTSHPTIPSFPQSTFNIPIIHSQQTGSYLRGDTLTSLKSITVVGGGKSAFDTVFLLLDAGKKVNWIIRPDSSGSGPLAIMSPTVLGLVNSMDVVATRFMAMLSPSIMNTKGPGYNFFHRTMLGRLFVRWFWWLVTKIAASHAGYDRSANAEKLRPFPYEDAMFWVIAGLGAASVPNFWKVFHQDDCTVHRMGIGELRDDKVYLQDGNVVEDTDLVVLCTGFDKSYQQFNPELQRELGLSFEGLDDAEEKRWGKLEAEAERVVDDKFPLLRESPLGIFQEESGCHDGPSRHYRRLVVPSLAAQGDRSILFPGFVHSIYTPLVDEVQALWGVAFLLGLNETPSLMEMESEVAEWNVWTRKRYPGQGRKHAYAIFDFFSYIDTLLRDLGVNPRRQTNILSHIFVPAYPKAYKGIQDEFKQARWAKNQKMKNM